MSQPNPRLAALMVATFASETFADSLTDAAASLGNLAERRVLTRLALVHDGGPVQTTALMGPPFTTTPALSRVVSSLVNRGYVERSEHETDRRLVLVSLTAKGADAFAGYVEAANAIADDVLGEVSAGEVEATRRVLGRAAEGGPDWPIGSPG